MKKGIVFLMASALLITVSCKKRGCTDPLANNYSSEAEKDNGSCDFSAIKIVNDITTNTTWTANKSYLIENTISVSNNATLTIEPGTIIRFGEGAEIDVSYSGDFGTIKAIGTNEKPIIFTSNATVKGKGDWDGIWLYEGANACEFTHCVFDYSGGYSNSGALTIRSATGVSVNNCIFKNSKYYGVEVDNYGSLNTFTNNDFINNDANDIKLIAHHVSSLGTGNTYTGNIEVQGGYIKKAGEERWLNQNTAFIIDGEISVGSETGTKWIIDPGCVLKFGSSDEVSIGYSEVGLIEAIGTVDLPITFTSRSNFPSKGDWDGIWFYSNSANGSVFDHCIVSYGGGYSASGNIVFKYEQGSDVTIKNSYISHSEGYGLDMYSAGDTAYPTLIGNTFSDNELGDKSW